MLNQGMDLGLGHVQTIVDASPGAEEHIPQSPC